MDTSCPSYRYTFRRDGRATYERLSPVGNGRLLDCTSAPLDSTSFARLAAAVYERGFFRLEPYYFEATDQTALTIRAVLPDTVKVVADNGTVGPSGLHELQALLDSAGARIPWEQRAAYQCKGA
jgi:hypothetical protein